jgi:NTP pyrophosphatase (non-canonical NTP hydrolase)
MSWQTDHGDCRITKKSIDWIMKNIQISRYNSERCYVYNKAMARWFDNNDAYSSNGTLADAHIREKHVEDQYDGQCRSGALSPTGVRQEEFNNCDCGKTRCDCMLCDEISQFDLIREWADERGLYENGDTKTQALKLVEEVGETCRAILKQDKVEIIDGIGDCVVVLTNLAELVGVSIEDCIAEAYHEISNRTGKMVNGTFKKD